MKALYIILLIIAGAAAYAAIDKGYDYYKAMQTAKDLADAANPDTTT